jgi:acetylornithine deacetylase/succinyl-diaminopimelate desuccinylase-like protein
VLNNYKILSCRKIELKPVFAVLATLSISLLFLINNSYAVGKEESGREAARYLTDIIRLKSINPPGNESLITDYLAKIFEREGIDYELLERDPGRANILARIKGSGKNRPILLYSHSDVVPTGQGWGNWTVDPFSGEVRDGYIYGRGAIDAKGLLVCHLEAFLNIHRNEVKLDRDLIFLVVAAEESGGGPGMRWLLREHPEKIDAEYALGEGGRLWIEDEKVKYGWIQAGEKSAHNLTVVAHGETGHASIPSDKNAASKLVHALDNIEHLTFEPQPNVVSDTFIRIMEPYIDSIFPGSPRYKAVTRNTISLTELKSGIKSNVIPDFAEANLNLRLMPGENLDDVTEMINDVINDSDVVVNHKPGVKNRASIINFDNDFYNLLTSEIEKKWPDIVIAPYLSTGMSDATRLRAVGISAYGLLPFPLRFEDASGIHGVDEKVSLNSLTDGVSLIYSIVYNWAAK